MLRRSPAAAAVVAAVVLVVLTVWCDCGDCAVVTVTGGPIVGSVGHSPQGRAYHAFRAVPYTGFVEGEHRFEVSNA